MINKIIPTIFALDNQTFDKKLEKLSFAEELHIDFMDGDFVKNQSIDIEDMVNILKYPKIIFEIHLMAKNPLKYISEIKKLKIKRILIQEEVFKDEKDMEKAIRTFKENNFELLIVLNPDTNLSRISKFLELIDGIMIMSVWPGEEKQEFIEKIFNKITEIREFVGEGFPIQIDGGIKNTNVKQIIDCGAQILSVGSFISSSNNPKKRYLELIRIINS